MFKDDPGDLVAGPLVVDEGFGAEFVDGQEAWPLNDFLTLSARLALNEGCKGQAREVVAGQKTFRSKVAVGVEVGMGATGLLRQQHQLGAGLLPKPLSPFPVVLGQGQVGAAAVLQVHLLAGRFKQPTPAAEGLVELVRGGADNIFHPGLGVPAGAAQLNLHGSEQASSLHKGMVGYPRCLNGIPDRLVERQAFHPDLQHFGGGVTQHRVGLGQPYRLHMGPDQVLVAQIDARRGNGT